MQIVACKVAWLLSMAMLGSIALQAQLSLTVGAGLAQAPIKRTTEEDLRLTPKGNRIGADRKLALNHAATLDANLGYRFGNFGAFISYSQLFGSLGYNFKINPAPIEDFINDTQVSVLYPPRIRQRVKFNYATGSVGFGLAGFGRIDDRVTAVFGLGAAFVRPQKTNPKEEGQILTDTAPFPTYYIRHSASVATAALVPAMHYGVLINRNSHSALSIMAFLQKGWAPIVNAGTYLDGANYPARQPAISYAWRGTLMGVKFGYVYTFIP